MDDIKFYFLKDENGVNNETDLLNFERLLYKSFQKDSPNGWIMNNYRFVENSRLLPTIPYKDVFIFIAKQNNQIVAGISGTLNMDNKLQLEEMGFSIDKKKENICEGLNFYISKESSKNFMVVLNTFLDKIVSELKKRNINIIYSTCSKKLINFYELFGFETLAHVDINGEPEYLIKYSIS